MKQPPRGPQDGPVNVTRIDDGMALTVSHNGETRTIYMTEYNAWRVFGMLSFMLEVKLPPNVAKHIKM